MEALFFSLDWSEGWLFILMTLILRYFILSGLAFLVYYIALGTRWQYRKIQVKYPQAVDYWREIGYSMLTFFIFATVATSIFFTPILGYTQVYMEVSQMGWGYLIFSFILMMLVHDTYFYWTHRIMHHRKLFKYFHRVHHLSHNPSPWAAFAFHPLEAVVEVGIIVVFVFSFPVHPFAIIMFLLSMVVLNINGHLGFELFPKNFQRHPIGKWFNTSTNHNMHHKFSNSNYGLYFTFWDKLMKTTHKNYEETYDEVKNRKPVETVSVTELEKA